MIPKSALCFQTGFHGKKNSAFQNPGYPTMDTNNPIFASASRQKASYRGNLLEYIIDDVPDTHNMSMQWTKSRLLPLKIFKANLQSAFFRDCFFLDGFEITYDSIKGCYKSIKINHSEILHQLMHHVTSILGQKWCTKHAIIIICFHLLIG